MRKKDLDLSFKINAILRAQTNRMLVLGSIGLGFFDSVSIGQGILHHGQGRKMLPDWLCHALRAYPYPSSKSDRYANKDPDESENHARDFPPPVSAPVLRSCERCLIQSHEGCPADRS